MKLKSIPNNIVVHTPTEAEAKELLAILHDNGWVWIEFSGEEDDITYWDRYEHKTCYNLKPGKIIGTEERNFYADEGYTILTLAEFKERYCEEEKPHPKFKSDYNVGDIVVVTGSLCVNKGNKITLLRHYDVPREANDYDNVWVGQNATGNTFAIAEKDFEPYTKPETKPTEDMETKDYPPYLDRPKAVVETPKKELNLCELLKGHEGETFFSLAYGEVNLDEIRRGTQRGDAPDFLCVRATTFDSGTIIVNPNGKLRNTGVVDLVPSRALYEQYPLDPYTAWMKWQEEQKKYILQICYAPLLPDDIKLQARQTVMTNLSFRTAADRDKCVSEIKAIIEKYSK
ncbi:MAG: hypothetical protein NC453_26330 [Muribaculum sp.]|nr:hypothetical protein [Muribaculum sp.]